MLCFDAFIYFLSTHHDYDIFRIFAEYEYDDIDGADTMSNASSDESNDFLPDEFTKNEELRKSMTSWALEHNINHTALKVIIEIINNRLGNEVLPKDPRTFMQTPRNVTIEHLENDEFYWHNGIKHCLEYLFSRVSEAKTISLNLNMDGLPLFNSSRENFWPILFNIHECEYPR